MITNIEAVCVASAVLCVVSAYLCRKAVGTVTKTLELDQEVFGPKRSLALEKMKQTVQWAESHARMQQLLDDIKSGQGLVKDPEILALAQRGHEASLRKEAELAAMSPEQREEDIRKWAENLAADVADLND